MTRLVLPLVFSLVAGCAYGPTGGYDSESETPSQDAVVSPRVPQAVPRQRQVRAELLAGDTRDRADKIETLAPEPILAGAE
jgi:hypothetical protein